MILLLSGEHGQHVLQQVKSALGLNLRPSAHVLRLKKPTSDWSPEDHALAEAYQYLNNEMCPECGHPVWVCRTRDTKVEFSVQSDVCQVNAAKGKSKKKLKDGEFLYVVPRIRGDWDAPLPDRESYYASLKEEKTIHDKGRKVKPSL